MTEALVALAQEPWGWHPDQTARLTDWQIINVYLLPAAKRAEQMRKDMKQPNASPGYTPNSITSLDSPLLDAEPTRQQVIDAAARLGKDVGKATAAYDARKRGGR